MSASYYILAAGLKITVLIANTFSKTILRIECINAHQAALLLRNLIKTFCKKDSFGNGRLAPESGRDRQCGTLGEAWRLPAEAMCENYLRFLKVGKRHPNVDLIGMPIPFRGA